MTIESNNINLFICDITPFTLQDFPDHTACILWFGGCNMRCVYCHNPDLALGKKNKLPWNDIYKFLQQRKNLLDGVVLSGGECTNCPKLLEFIKILKDLGYKVKIDTNGLKPEILYKLAETSNVDFIALDYKAPKEKFVAVTGKNKFEIFRRSLQFLCKSSIDFEVRTTVHTDLLNEKDIFSIIEDLDEQGFKGNYYIQNFQPTEKIMGDLPDKQKNKLDISLIKKPKNFKLLFRNFS